jgi:hypothetical protein
MKSWFFMNSCFCVWIDTYQEQVKAISSHEIIPRNHGMKSWCDVYSLYEIMVFGYFFKPLLENGLFMVWLNTMKFWMKFGINSWCDGMNSNYEIFVLNCWTWQSLRRQVRGFGRILRADMREMDTERPEAASTGQGQDRPGAALRTNNKNTAYWRGWE